MKKFTNIKDLARQITKDVNEAHGKAVAKVDVELDRVIESLDEFSDLGFIDHDIVDTGRLRDSKVITAKPNSVTFTYAPVSPENGYPYAPAVFHGFFAWGKKYIPGRPWTVRAVKNENPTGNIAIALEEMGYGVTVKNDGVQLLGE